MSKESFAERLKAAMEKQGKKQVDLINAAALQGVKLGKSHISQYVSGKTVPRSDILHFLASELNVEEEWLKGAETETQQREIEPESNKTELLEANTMRTFKNHQSLTMFYMM